MSIADNDNIPLLDDLIESGTPIQNIDDNFKPTAHEELELQINTILQRHTSQAVAEIMALVETQK